MQLRKVVSHGNTRWRVSSYVDGKRKQRFFVSKELAIQWMQELRSDTRCANFWCSRSPLEQKDIIAAFDVAQQRKLPLLKAVLAAKNRPYPTNSTATIVVRRREFIVIKVRKFFIDALLVNKV